MEWLALPIILWILILFILVPAKGTYKSIADRIAGGRLRDDRTALGIMLQHLQDNPEEWAISRGQASFPAESKAKQIYISFDDNKKALTYTLSSSGERERVLDGYYGAKFGDFIAKENDRRQSKALVRNLYGIDGPLLLR